VIIHKERLKIETVFIEQFLKRGQLGGVWSLDLEPIMELPPNGYLTSFYSGNVSSDRLNRMLQFIEEHHVNAAPEKVFMLEQTADAHRYLESSLSFGKTVIML